MMHDELAHGKDELPPLWVDIQESIDDKIKDVDDKCKMMSVNDCSREVVRTEIVEI